MYGPGEASAGMERVHRSMVGLTQVSPVASIIVVPPAPPSTLTSAPLVSPSR